MDFVPVVVLTTVRTAEPDSLYFYKTELNFQRNELSVHVQKVGTNYPVALHLKNCIWKY